MQTATEFVLHDLTAVVEAAECGVFVNPLSQVHFQVFVHARNGVGGMKVVMDWQLDPSLAMAGVKCYVGGVNPQNPGKAKPEKTASFGFHEFCGDKYVAMKAWLAETLKPVAKEKGEGVEIPAELLGMLKDERFDAAGIALPNGRCDECGEPDSVNHRCKVA